jgi:hypothetical protein
MIIGKSVPIFLLLIWCMKSERERELWMQLQESGLGMLLLMKTSKVSVNCYC